MHVFYTVLYMSDLLKYKQSSLSDRLTIATGSGGNKTISYEI